MATLTANAAQAVAPTKAIHVGVNSVQGSYDLSASLSAGDVIRMVKVPAGAKVIGGHVNLNAGAANTLTVTVGDGNDPNRYLDSTSAPQTDVVQFAPATLDYSYSAADTVDITITAVSGATATGSLKLTLLYQMD